mgnify:CR=1 FL=1
MWEPAPMAMERLERHAGYLATLSSQKPGPLQHHLRTQGRAMEELIEEIAHWLAGIGHTVLASTDNHDPEAWSILHATVLREIKAANMRHDTMAQDCQDDNKDSWAHWCAKALDEREGGQGSPSLHSGQACSGCGCG